MWSQYYIIYGYNYILITIADVMVINNKFYRSQFIHRSQMKEFIRHNLFIGHKSQIL